METKPVFSIACPDYLITGKCNMKCKYCFEHDKIPNDIDSELVKEYLSHNPSTSGFIFGGEPLMAIDKVCEILDAIINNPKISRERKLNAVRGTRRIITNGTLVPKYVDIIKKYNMEIQISIDGCKEANDLNRVFANGKGSYDTIIKAIECCVENNIPWSLHGVFRKSTLSYIFESFKWFFNIYTKYNGIEFPVEHLKHNTYQIIFEDEYTDDDVDVLIDQFGKIGEWIVNHEELSEEQKLILFDNWFFKTGATCGVGTGLMALDDKLNIFPCHRTVFGKSREETILGNVFEPENFNEKNFHLYNALHNIGRKKKYMYSVVTQLDNWKNKIDNTWFMWCPSTNLQETGSPYFQPVKYNLMFTELNRFIKQLRVHYFGDRGFNNSNELQQCKS